MMKVRNDIFNSQSGMTWLILNILLYIVAVGVFILGATGRDPIAIVASIILFLLALFVSPGFFTLQPNQNAVMILFGEYKGTEVSEGFHWANPFIKKLKISMRTRNFNTDALKVNDKSGNPIEIGAVVVWKVETASNAVFDVDDFEEYVMTQSESAVRHLATSYPYDIPGESEGISLRGSTEEVSKSLQTELQERMHKAGIRIEEARLSHLAYAPEIAGAMLQRQQAQAIVDARSTIVEGAVSMVEMALERLQERNVVVMDEDKQATMVSNLLVVLCSDKAVSPVVNTGSLYQ